MEAGKSRWYWLVQALSGAALIVLVGVHLIAQHFLAAGGLRTYAEVVAYLREPVALGLEISFLVVVAAHALMGVRAIFADLDLSANVQRSIDMALWAVGVVTVLYGLQLTWQVIQY